MIRFLLLLGLLAGCAAPAGAPVLAGPVDPERVLLADAAPAEAAPLCRLRLRASLPVSVVGVPIVPAEINGEPASLVFDTGAESSMLTAAAARRLRVTSRYDFVRPMSGIGRTVVTGDAALRSMTLGGLRLPYPRALVADVPLRVGGQEVDGLLGASILSDFDLDIDMPHGRVGLYDRTACPTLRPPWEARAIGVPTTRSLSQHPFFPMRVGGRTLSATLDTGAQRTVVAARAAAAIGIAPGDGSGRPLQARGAAGETIPATLHAVPASVGGVPLPGPIVVTAAGLPRDIDALLGLDFLLSHRVWLSYGSRVLFVQPE